MRKWREVLPVAAIVLGVSGLAAGYEVFVPHRHPPPGVSLTTLSSVHQLQARFNADRGEPRLILILSPT